MHSPSTIEIRANGSWKLDFEGASRWGWHTYNSSQVAFTSGIWVFMTQHLVPNERVNDGPYYGTEFHLPYGTWMNSDDRRTGHAYAWHFLVGSWTSLWRGLGRCYFGRGYIEELNCGNSSTANWLQGGGINQDGDFHAVNSFEPAASGTGARAFADGLDNAAAIWFLVYRFCWKHDLSFFYAAVPRIGAGIIVGYLPVFLIDEVWDLASQPITVLGNVVLLLGLVTLLYIYVEVQRRLDDTRIAFARARAIFVLGVLQAFALGIVMTGLVGSFMVERNWEASVEVLSRGEIVEGLVPLVGQLPLVIGIAPLYAFPSAVLVMTFLSFFIGVFLQLMWEELPITEPL